MTRKEHLVFCKKCTKRDFNINEGVLCSLTGQKADFNDSCPDYQLDKRILLDKASLTTILPNEKRAALATTMIWAVLTINLFSIISNYFQYDLLQDLNEGVYVEDATIEANDLRIGLISILYLVVYIISAVTFIQWFRRAYNNLAARTRINHSEGWAAGGWFVPIICLFRPYAIMKELFEKTDKLISDKTGLTVKNNQMILVGIWWGLWILVGYIGNYSLKTVFKEDTIENISNGTLADIAASLLEIPIGILAILIISVFIKKEKKLLQLESEEQKELRAA